LKAPVHLEIDGAGEELLARRIPPLGDLPWRRPRVEDLVGRGVEQAIEMKGALGAVDGVGHGGLWQGLRLALD